MAKKEFFYDTDTQSYYTLDKKGKRHDISRGDLVNGALSNGVSFILKVIIIIYWGTMAAGGLVYMYAHAP